MFSSSSSPLLQSFSSQLPLLLWPLLPFLPSELHTQLNVLCCFFQLDQELLLFLMSLLHFLPLLFEHLGIVLGDTRVNRR